MLTVTKLKGNKGAKPLKLKVCAIGSTQKYVTDGEKKGIHSGRIGRHH